jgi:hypothetical protein
MVTPSRQWRCLMALVKNSVKLNNGKAVFVNEMNEYEA